MFSAHEVDSCDEIHIWSHYHLVHLKDGSTDSNALTIPPKDIDSTQTSNTETTDDISIPEILDFLLSGALFVNIQQLILILIDVSVL